MEFHPVGVAGAIVPWNYPVHNFFNPLIAHLFAGNAIVIKVRRGELGSTPTGLSTDAVGRKRSQTRGHELRSVTN